MTVINFYENPPEVLDRNCRIVTQDELEAVVHELRTPLHSIIGFARLMLNGSVSDDEVQREFLSSIVEQGESLRDLVRGLLEKSQENYLLGPLHIERISIVDLLRKAIDDLSYLMLDRKVSVVSDCPEAVPDGLADAHKLRHVFANVIGNAIKYCQKETIVNLKVEVDEENLIVSVEDQGDRIPSENTSMIFEKFARASNSDAPGSEGSGLGLYITKKVIEIHGGNIYADDFEGKGCRITMSIPWNTAPDRSEAHRAELERIKK